MKIIARIRSDFPTKFGMVDPILNLNHNGKIIATSNDLETVFEVVLPLCKN